MFPGLDMLLEGGRFQRIRRILWDIFEVWLKVFEVDNEDEVGRGSLMLYTFSRLHDVQA